MIKVMHSEKKTERAYGFLWKKGKNISPLNKWHFNNMQEVIGEPIVRGLQGIDIGSGCGYDTYIMAKSNPCTKIVSIDLSDGVYRTRELASVLKNVQIIKCSILDAPIKDNIFDFAYSFGVLHHTSKPKKGLLEIARILKRNSPAFLYLYEDHSQNLVKYIAVKLIAKLRNITIRIPAKIIYALSWMFSPFIFIIFSFPSRFLRKFKPTQCFAKKIPFNFGTGLFSLRGDLYDRFSTPIEHRFSGQDVYNLFSECGFYNVSITRLNDSSGWVAWGYKK
ncbi:MAG: class I SAM-dependent methyltransferase [Candidatus Omnitrophica bacterium]|nr:class I SAM-dependent methyltransferase [Candidatus Omnitrophota bacterium]